MYIGKRAVRRCYKNHSLMPQTFVRTRLAFTEVDINALSGSKASQRNVFMFHASSEKNSMLRGLTRGFSKAS